MKETSCTENVTSILEKERQEELPTLNLELEGYVASSLRKEKLVDDEGVRDPTAKIQSLETSDQVVDSWLPSNFGLPAGRSHPYPRAKRGHSIGESERARDFGFEPKPSLDG